ncbi:MAG: MgtC/SapB family protein [Stenotrophobium sp.]
MLDSPSNMEVLTRLGVAAVLGSIIGLERERLNWAAGLRTHMLVCVGSSLIMLVSAYGFDDVLGKAHVELDPSRMAAQVVSGIGFLCAGSILLRGEVIRGLTTAASLWSVAGIGLAVGGGLYMAAFDATLVILVILAGIKPLERWLIAAKEQRGVHLIADRGSVSLNSVDGILGSGSARVKQLIVKRSDDNPDLDEAAIELSQVTTNQYNAICVRLKNMPGVRECIRDAHIDT